MPTVTMVTYRADSEHVMPQTEPLAPPTKPREEPAPTPAPRKSPPPPSPQRKPDPFNPDWPKTRPTPEPKAQQARR